MCNSWNLNYKSFRKSRVFKFIVSFADFVSNFSSVWFRFLCFLQVEWVGICLEPWNFSEKSHALHSIQAVHSYFYSFNTLHFIGHCRNRNMELWRYNRWFNVLSFCTPCTSDCNLILILDIGPSNWPGFCQTGKSQSPINIDTSAVSEKRIPSDPFIFRGYNRAPKSSQLLNNGHSIKLSFKELKKAQNLPSVISTMLTKYYRSILTIEQISDHWRRFKRQIHIFPVTFPLGRAKSLGRFRTHYWWSKTLCVWSKVLSLLQVSSSIFSSMSFHWSFILSTLRNLQTIQTRIAWPF